MKGIIPKYFPKQTLQKTFSKAPKDIYQSSEGHLPNTSKGIFQTLSKGHLPKQTPPKGHLILKEANFQVIPEHLTQFLKP